MTCRISKNNQSINCSWPIALYGYLLCELTIQLAFLSRIGNGVLNSRTNIGFDRWGNEIFEIDDINTS